jgi:hypothetical protein
MGSILAMIYTAIKRVAVLGSLCLLTACSNAPAGPVGLKSLFFGGEQTQKFAALSAQGAPALAVALPGSRKNTNARFLRQGTSSDGVESWITGNDISLDIRRGMIVGSRGFGGDLMAADASETARLIAERRGGIVTRYHTEFGGDDIPKARAFKCRVTNKGPWTSKTPKGDIATVLMQEDCRGENVSFRNFFWVSPNSGTIIQSRQWLTPTLDYLTTQHL